MPAQDYAASQASAWIFNICIRGALDLSNYQAYGMGAYNSSIARSSGDLRWINESKHVN